MKKLNLMKSSLLLTMIVLNGPVFASKKDPSLYINLESSSQQIAEKKQMLQTLQVDMSAKFSNVEAELKAGHNESALALAKQVLDTVRVKTGIDPKNKIRQNFLVPIKFPVGAISMDDLDGAQREVVIRTISDYGGGLYMDIMNLSKRTTLLYIKAFQSELEKNGGLNSEDKTKIIKDLVNASLIPMPIEDKVGNKIFAFDEDVANEDHTYLFNRELKMFLIEDKALNVTESTFNASRSELKKEILDSLHSSFEKKVTSSFHKAQECTSNASQIPYSDDRNSAIVHCFNKYYSQTTTFAECKTLASYIPYTDPQNAAKVICTEKFNN